jgi:transcriptional regulator with XRE-family HTH domain
MTPARSSLVDGEMTHALAELPYRPRPSIDGTSETEGIGERLRSARRARGLTQRDLQSAGVTFGYICRIERGTRVPSVEVIRRLADALNVSALWLETGEEGRWELFSHGELAAMHAALVRAGGPASLRLAAELADVLAQRAERELGDDEVPA